MKILRHVGLGIVLLATMADIGWARTLYWDGLTSRQTLYWDQEIHDISAGNVWEWDWNGGYASVIGIAVNPGFVKDPDDPDSALLGYIDSTIISNDIDIPEADNLRFGFVGGTYIDYQQMSGYEYSITDDILTFGIQLDDGTRVQLGTAPEDYRGRPVLDFYGVHADITDKIPEDGTARFWWRGDLHTYNVYLNKFVTEVCLLTDCPSSEIWGSQDEVIDGWIDLKDLYPKRGYTEAVTCLEPEQAGRFLRGLKLRAKSSDPNVDFRGVVYLPDNLPDQAPNAFAMHHVDRSAQIPWGDEEITTDFVCDEIALDPVSVDKYLCVGVNVDDELAYDLGGNREALVAYKDVGAGNSRSYTRNINPYYPGENTGWTWLDDKEFIFSAVMDVDCDGAPTTTTTSTTTATTTTTTTAATTSTSTTNTSSTTSTTSTGSTSTTTSTVTTTTTTTTIPDAVDDDSMDDDSSDDDTAADDAATSDDNDDTSGCGR